MLGLSNRLVPLLKNTGLSRPLFWMRDLSSHKKHRAKYRQVYATGKIQQIALAELFTTMSCNLACRMCHQREYRRISGTDLTAAQQRQCVDRIYDCGIRRVWLMGGEIFVRRDISSLLDYLQKKGMRVDIVSNGLVFDAAVAERMSAYGNIKRIEFSLDGLEGTHDYLRGFPGSFERVVNAIRLAVAKRKFTVVVAFTLQKENFSEVKTVIDFCRRLGVDILNITLRMNYTDKEIADSAQALGLSPAQLSVGRSDGSPATYSAGDLRGIRDLLQRENKGLMRLALYPQIAGDFPDEFASGRIRESGIKLYCNCLDVAVVDHNGEVLACGFIKKSFGNILQRPLKDILDSEEFTSQRQGLLKENLLPICSRCCALGYLK